MDAVNDGDSASVARNKINTAIAQVDVNTNDISQKQGLDLNLTEISNISFIDNDSIYMVASVLTKRNPTQAKAILAIGTSDVSGLSAALATKQDGFVADTTIWTVVNAGDGDYTLSAAQNKVHIYFNVSSGRVLTIPLNGTAAILTGAEFRISNLPTGSNTVTLGVEFGVTLHIVNDPGSAGVLVDGEGGTLTKIAADTWVFAY